MDRLESVLKEERVFYPSEEFRKQAHIKSEEEYQRLYEESVRDPEGFWGRVASELHWFEPWRKVLEWEKREALCCGIREPLETQGR